jgi:hypothetical protein
MPMNMKKLFDNLKRVVISTEEIDILINTYLKAQINKSKMDCVVLGQDNLGGLKPKFGKAFIGAICEPECWRGRYYICIDPCYSILTPGDEKLMVVRKICEKQRKSGICRRALIKFEYI